MPPSAVMMSRKRMRKRVEVATSRSAAALACSPREVTILASTASSRASPSSKDRNRAMRHRRLRHRVHQGGKRRQRGGDAGMPRALGFRNPGPVETVGQGISGQPGAAQGFLVMAPHRLSHAPRYFPARPRSPARDQTPPPAGSRRRCPSPSRRQRGKLSSNQ